MLRTYSSIDKIPLNRDVVSLWKRVQSSESRSMLVDMPFLALCPLN
jgi:hypothetical protein